MKKNKIVKFLIKEQVFRGNYIIIKEYLITLLNLDY